MKSCFTGAGSRKFADNLLASKCAKSWVGEIARFQWWIKGRREVFGRYFVKSCEWRTVGPIWSWGLTRRDLEKHSRYEYIDVRVRWALKGRRVGALICPCGAARLLCRWGGRYLQDLHQRAWLSRWMGRLAVGWPLSLEIDRLTVKSLGKIRDLLEIICMPRGRSRAVEAGHSWRVWRGSRDVEAAHSWRVWIARCGSWTLLAGVAMTSLFVNWFLRSYQMALEIGLKNSGNALDSREYI